METTLKMERATKLRNFALRLTLLCSMVSLMVGQAFAFGEDVTISNKDVGADELMGKIIGMLLSITRYVGVALVIYGVYEVVMSFMQNQPEAKTKGIIMALAGAIMIALKSVLGTGGLGLLG